MEAKEKIYFKLCKKLNDKGEVTEKNILGLKALF